MSFALTPTDQVPGLSRGGAIGTQLDFGFGATQVSSNNNITQQQNQFTDLSRQFAGAAGQQLGQAGQPLVDLEGTGVSAGGVQSQGQAVQDQFGNLVNSISQGAQTQFDPTAFANLQFDRLQSLASRGEDIAANRVAGGLFSRGRLGANDTASGAAFEGLARAQGDARTNRALEATSLANREASRLFQQGQVGVNNQFNLLGARQGEQSTGFNQLLGGSAFNFEGQQQQLNQAQQFGASSGQVLDPNFQALNLATGFRLADQGTRADVNIARRGQQATRSAGRASAIGNLVGGSVGGFLAGRS